MTDMPELIWAKAEMEYGAIVIGLFADTVRYLPEGTMYRRADLPPKVKPLEWKQYEGDIFCAKTPWGCYFAQWDDEVGAFFLALNWEIMKIRLSSSRKTSRHYRKPKPQPKRITKRASFPLWCSHDPHRPPQPAGRAIQPRAATSAHPRAT